MTLIKYELSDNKSLLVESSDSLIYKKSPDNHMMENVNLGGMADKVVSVSKNAFDASLESLTHFSKAVFDKIKDISPDEVELELSVKISGEGGLIIAKAKTEGNFSLKLTWKK